MPIEDKAGKEKLLQLLKDAVAKDNSLRDKYQMGEKFRFIRDRLQALLTRTEENIKVMQAQEEKTSNPLTSDEVLVYIYLYNAQGMVMATWNKLLLPKVYYEYSVNRPIYADKKIIDNFIRSRANRAQHGYLTVVINKKDLLPVENEPSKDILGNPLIRVREGSLLATKTISFSHNDNHYEVDEEGNLKLIKSEKA